MTRSDRSESNDDADRDGVRVIRSARPESSSWLIGAMVAIAVLVALALGFRWPSTGAIPVDAPSASGSAPSESQQRDETATREPQPRSNSMRESRRPPSTWAPTLPADQRSGDDNDIASYVSPDDPEPSMAEVIEALRASGEHGGIAAFNPPGTSPPLMGLVVPEEYVLPAGYVRHHQVTDDGQRIQPILMFSPDFEFRDAAGELIAIPEDRVVTPELAPPDLPIQPVVIPPPQ